MLELPTIKTDFLFKNSQDFKQTTHARPQHPIVFIDIISLYFNCISSVKYLFKRSWSQSHHAFFCSMTQAQTQKIEYAYFERWKKCLRIVLNGNFFLFHIPKWRLMRRDSRQLRKIRFVSILHVISFCNYFKTTLRPN